MNKLRSEIYTTADLMEPVPDEMASKITSFLRSPTMGKWDAIHGVIVKGVDSNAFGLSLWEAWMAVHPEAPATKTLDHWAEIPTRNQLVRAIRFAAMCETHGQGLGLAA